MNLKLPGTLQGKKLLHHLAIMGSILKNSLKIQDILRFKSLEINTAPFAIYQKETVPFSVDIKNLSRKLHLRLSHRIYEKEWVKLRSEEQRRQIMKVLVQ